MPFELVIIGAGHNGLVAAAVLAKAGLRTLVLEASDRIGGCAVTGEIAPGFTCSTLSHRATLDPGIVRALDLERHGLHQIRPEVLSSAPTLDGRALVLWRDPLRAARSIEAFSGRDAQSYPRFTTSIAAVSRVLRLLASAPAPDLDSTTTGDLLALLRAGVAFRSLDKTNAYRLLRWLPMPVADFATEWFESELLRATIAADGLLGAFAGPRSAGTTAAMLWLAAGDGQPIAPGWTVRGGMGALSDALAAAARAAGAEIRTLARVARILVTDGRATAVVLDGGEEIGARTVVSNADPRRTLLDLVEPVHLAPEFRRRMRNIRMRGTLAKLNFAVSSLPAFTGLASTDDETRREALGGAVRLAPTLDYIERAFDAAKYGACSTAPWIELTVPSLADPALAPAGAHVVSAYAQFAPADLRGTNWDAEGGRFADAVTRTIDDYAPGFARSVTGRQVITPRDLESTFGLTGGHIFHGELALDQLSIARPTLGCARHQTPIRGLFLCGAGTHPGSGLDGRSGWLAAKAVLRAIGR